MFKMTTLLASRIEVYLLLDQIVGSPHYCSNFPRVTTLLTWWPLHPCQVWVSQEEEEEVGGEGCKMMMSVEEKASLAAAHNCTGESGGPPA